MSELANEVTMRLVVVLHPKIEVGPAANAAAIVIGGLRCAAFGEAIQDADGHLHAAILWNLVVLKSKSGSQLGSLLTASREADVQAVAFGSLGQQLSNSFVAYREQIANKRTSEIELVAVGLYGPDEKVRQLTRAFSVFR